MAGDGNKSYNIRSSARTTNSRIYEQFISGLQLSPDDRAALRKRGLTEENINDAEYVTKPPIRSTELGALVAQIDKSQNLEKVPGFYWDEKLNRRTVAPRAGLVIPVRSLIGGNIHHLLIRPDPKPGQRAAKYENFSSGDKPQGKATYAATHCPVISSLTKEQITRVRITEGVLKADVACALDNTAYTIGLPGLHAPEDLQSILNELEVSTVVLAFDMEETLDVRAKRLKLYNELKADYDVQIEVWDPQHKGIDDALLHARDSIRLLEQDEVNKLLERSAEIDPLKSGYIYIIRTKRFIHQTEFDEWDHEQFSSLMMMNGVGEVIEMLSANNATEFPRCMEIEFAPTQPPIFNTGRVTKFNLWRPNPVESSPGDVTPFLDHMKYLFSDEQECRHLLQWISYQVQNPGEKIHFAALVQGTEGIGKSFLGNVMDILLGRHNISRPTNDEIHEVYTSWERNCQLVIVEEIMANERRELMNKLKPKITEPMTRVREMRKDSYSQPNRYNMLLLTNYQDAMPIDENDRRYLVMFSSAQPQQPEYYKHLFEWLEKPENKSALLHWAENYDLSGFEAKGHAPKTTGRKEMISQVMSPFDQYIKSCLEERQWPFNSDIVSLHDVSVSKDIPPRFRGFGEKKWANALKRHGAGPLSDQAIEIVPGLPKRRVWVLRRVDFWRAQALVNWQHEYNKHNGGVPGGIDVLAGSHPM